MSLTIKFALFTSVLCLVIIGSTSYLSYKLSYRALEQSLGEKLQAIAATASLGIDGDLHDEIRTTPENYREVHAREPFLSIREHLRKVKEINQMTQEIYTFRRQEGKLQYVVMTHDDSYYDTYEIQPAMLPTLNDGKTTYTGIYGDENGHWISGYAPIKDGDGNVKGLLEVDYRVDEFMALLRRKYQPLLWKTAGFSLFAVLMSFLLAGRVTAKLNYLTDLTEKISLGKMDTPIQVKGGDEVAKLGASLERMRESLKIAAELLN